MPFAPRSDSPNSSWPFVGSEDEWPFTTVDTWPFGNGTSWPFDETPGDPPEITTSSLPNGTDGTAYSETLAVTTTTPGTNPWSISSGSLPSGLSLNASTGEISGTPDTVETANFTVQYEDQYGRTDTQALSIEVEAGVLLAELDFSGMSDDDPFEVPSGWTEDYTNTPIPKIASGVWTTQGSGGQSLHADVGTLDLDAETKVFVEAVDWTQDTKELAYSNSPAILLSSDYAPGTWRAPNNGSMTGYVLKVYDGSIRVFGMLSGGFESSNNFGDPGFVGNDFSGKVTLKVTVGGSSNTVQVFIDDVQLGSDWTDNDANRPTNFRTIGGSLNATTGSDSMTKLSGGTFT